MTKESVTKKMDEQFATIAVQSRYLDGYHIFTSNEVKGLHVALKDPKVAYEAVTEVLTELIAVKTENREFVIVPTMSFDEWINDTPSPKSPHVRRPRSIRSRQYLVRRAEAA